jgi:hypothetical protein
MVALRQPISMTLQRALATGGGREQWGPVMEVSMKPGPIEVYPVIYASLPG